MSDMTRNVLSAVSASVKGATIRILTRLLRPVVEVVLEEDCRNIARQRQRLALGDTARFVDQNLANVPSFASKVDLLREALRLSSAVQGLVCEFGVYEGGTIAVIADYLRDRTVYGFDSFEGLPEDWFDGIPRGSFKLDAPPRVPGNVSLVKGWFSDTLAPFLAEHGEPAAFLHVDCDLYSSSKTVLSAFLPRIVPGTVMVFDEFFNYPGWRSGEFQAFNEVVGGSGLRFQYIGYVRYREQVAVKFIETQTH